MSEESEVQAACFISKRPSGETTIPIQFKPASLQYEVTNTLREEESGGATKQYVSKSTGKLTMDLVYDTTHNGEDVRTFSTPVANLMEPDPESGTENKTPAIVEFSWGTYSFQGMMETFKEIIDFFSSDGVPLRSSINVVLSKQDQVFSQDSESAEGDDAVEVPQGESENATTAATQAGNSRAGKAVAAENGMDSMRFNGGGSLTVGGSVTLGGPVAFSTGASAGAGLGIGAGASAGIGIGGGASAGAGIGGSASAGIGIGVSASAGISGSLGGGLSAQASASTGSSSSAGVSASAGAFAGLRAGASAQASFKLEPSRLLPKIETTAIATDAGASFGIGGAASASASGSLRANVGAGISLQAKIKFE